MYFQISDYPWAYTGATTHVLQKKLRTNMLHPNKITDQGRAEIWSTAKGLYLLSYVIFKGPFIFYLGGWAGGNRGWATQNKWPKKGGLCQNFCQGRGGSRKNHCVDI